MTQRSQSNQQVVRNLWRWDEIRGEQQDWIMDRSNAKVGTSRAATTGSGRQSCGPKFFKDVSNVCANVNKPKFTAQKYLDDHHLGYFVYYAAGRTWTRTGMHHCPPQDSALLATTAELFQFIKCLLEFQSKRINFDVFPYITIRVHFFSFGTQRWWQFAFV